MLKILRTFAVIGSLVAASVVVNPQTASATCAYDSETGAQQSSGTSQYYGGWLNIYNYDDLAWICTQGWEEQYLAVEMPNNSAMNFGFKQSYGMTPGTSVFFADFYSYPSGGAFYTYGTAGTAATYSIRAYSSSIVGLWVLEETAGSTFTPVDNSPDMGVGTGKMSGVVAQGGLGTSDASLSTNWADTQNRYNGGWGYWTHEVCYPYSDIPNWKVNFGTIGDFYTSNFTHTGAC